MIYLDHNATSPLLPQARDAWLEAAERFPGNPSSPHRIGARADSALENARQRLAAVLGCAAPEVVFTSGATEACTTVWQHLAARTGADDVVALSAIEHPAVIESARHYFGARVRVLAVDASGVVDLAGAERLLQTERVACVALMAANNETGVLQPWTMLRGMCVARGVNFFCDATQWCGRLPAAGLGGCSFVVGSAHKFGGPRGVGFLKCPAGLKLNPLLRGGNQQDGRRAGTENVPGVLAMLVALEWCEARLAAGELPHRQEVRDHFVQRLQRAIPGVSINGGDAPRLWNTVSVLMPELPSRHRWVVKLDKAGFAVSTGSACASGSEHPSPVLTAMGLAPCDAAKALRFSSGWTTPPVQWESLLQALVTLQRELGGV